MKRALLLNADFDPMHFISDIDAFVLVYKGTAEILDMNGRLSVWNGEELISPSQVWPCPATVRLYRRVNKRWRPPRFRKKVLFSRDNWECQYCQASLQLVNITVDHVVPRSRGGKTTWKNCVASCRACNKKKADMTPAEAGMLLRRLPTDPSSLHFWDVSKGNCWHDDWGSFISRR